MATSKLAIVHHSGYGHTKRVAEHVHQGANTVDGVEATLYDATELSSPDSGPWTELAAADGIVFGAPTYMGSASAPMKQFMDASSKVWFGDGWKDKIAAGFTNSGSLAGDKLMTLQQFAIFAAQHGMTWVNLGMKSGYNATDQPFESAHNRSGHFLGLATQSLTDQSAEDAPDEADLETAVAFGRRVAEATARWARGAR